MNRNPTISKQTEDKVKLAKQYIENKYQAMIKKQIEDKVKWAKIVQIINQSKLEAPEKHIYAQKIIERENIKKRLLRQKDCLKNYQLHLIIGRGAFGEVRLAKNITTNQLVAIKRMQKKKLIGKKQISSAFLERQFMIQNNSKFLVQMKSTFQDKKYLYIVMQYVNGGDLLHLLIEKDIFTEEETRFYIASLVLAVQEVHRSNFIHRDIKPDNILIDKTGHVKISDFGLSKYLEKDTSTEITNNLTKIANVQKHNHIVGRNRKFSKVGTPDYISPEILTDQTYDQRVDIWSIGVIMFECLFGYPPFTHEDSKEVCQRVMKWEEFLQFPEDLDASLEAKMLILGMMSEKDERMSLKQIKKHPFFDGFNWQKVSKMKPPFVPKIKHQLDTSNFEKYEEEQPWLRTFQKDFSNLDTRDEFNHHRKRSSSLPFQRQYHFAGFDFKKENNEKDNSFNETIKQIEMMTKYRTPNNPNKPIKRVSTEHSLMKRLQTDYSCSQAFKKVKKGKDSQVKNLPKQQLLKSYKDTISQKNNTNKTLQQKGRILKKTVPKGKYVAF